MLIHCPKCASSEVKDKTATLYFSIATVLAVIGVVLIFVSWPWAFLVIAFMLISVMLAVEVHHRKYICKNCDHEWEGEYSASGEMTPPAVVEK